MAEQDGKRKKGARIEKRKYYKQYNFKTLIIICVLCCLFAILINFIRFKTPVPKVIVNTEKTVAQQIIIIREQEKKLSDYISRKKRGGKSIYKRSEIDPAMIEKVSKFLNEVPPSKINKFIDEVGRKINE